MGTSEDVGGEPGTPVAATTQAGETGKVQAVYDPAHPHASPRSGYVPPEATRFDGKPGPGRPKGSHSARAAIQRKWRKGWQDDADAEDEADKIGTEARKVGDAIHAAALAGDAEKVRALAGVIDQVEGRPQERIEHSGSTARTLIVFPGEDSDAPPPALLEGEA